MQPFDFSKLSTVDLHIDAVYQSGRKGNSGDDPFSRLLGVSTGGGFRYKGSIAKLEMVVLTSTLSDPDWPDTLDRETGIYTYYGDNKRPGTALHDTPRKGNGLLSRIFQDAQTNKEGRNRVPPIFVFANTGEWRDVTFLGLAVPGTSDVRVSEDLVAIWKLASGGRFQNYRARFTIVDAPQITRIWINDILSGNPHTSNAPKLWKKWIDTGHPTPLVASRSIEYRKKGEQLPSKAGEMAIIQTVQKYFSKHPYLFESCAASIVKMLLPDIASIDLTRPSRDGGRDAVGYLRIGSGNASILVDFAMEAKCYGTNHGAGVREMSRLISRLRHRQFGIFVITSYLDVQAYKEIKEDRHPIIVLAANDILALLKRNGYSDEKSVHEWLQLEFPVLI